MSAFHTVFCISPMHCFACLLVPCVFDWCYSVYVCLCCRLLGLKTHKEWNQEQNQPKKIISLSVQGEHGWSTGVPSPMVFSRSKLLCSLVEERAKHGGAITPWLSLDASCLCFQGKHGPRVPFVGVLKVSGCDTGKCMWSSNNTPCISTRTSYSQGLISYPYFLIVCCLAYKCEWLCSKLKGNKKDSKMDVYNRGKSVVEIKGWRWPLMLMPLGLLKWEGC